MNDQEIQQTLAQLQARNKRVEADKAWETSRFRIGTILVITYVIAALVLYILGVERYYLSALIPTIGFLLSTMSLPIIKRYWIKKYYHRND